MASAKKESKFFDILKTQLSHTCPLNEIRLSDGEATLRFEIGFDSNSKLELETQTRKTQKTQKQKRR